MSKEEIIHFPDKESWRAWLLENHNKKTKIAVLNHKKHTGKPSMSHKEAMFEAICFGWIDTTIKSLDKNTFIRRFSKRTEKSNWSDNTLSYAKQLIKENKMHPSGLYYYNLGKSKPSLDHGMPKNPKLPEEIKIDLEKLQVLEKYNSLAPSTKKNYIRWYLRAKQPETKEKRKQQIIQAVKSNKKLF